MVDTKNASLSDFNAVFNFMCSLENEVFDKGKMREIFTKNLDDANIIYLMGFYNNIPAAFISCHIQNLLHHNEAVAEIQELFVAKEYRKKNFGKELITSLRVLLKKRNVKQLEVCSNRKRVDAQAFYLSCGFTDSHKKFVGQL